MKNVPKLRFNGFSDEWKSELVGELFSEVRNGFVGTATPYYVEEGVPYLQSNNIRKNKIDTNKMVYITKEFHLKNKKSILKKGDILMVQSGHAGECAVVPVEFEGANCHALIVMTPKKNTNSTYCSYYINSELGQRRLFKLITGNTIKHILASEIKEFKIKAPTAKEQEKIANFLTKVDKLIEKQDEKVSNLELYKKGMMQKIFSQEIRFKKDDGGEYPEWEKSTFEKVLIEDLHPVDKPSERYEKLSVRSHAKGTFSSLVEKPDEVAMDTLYEVKENQLIVNITFAWEHAIAIVKKEDEGKLVSHRFPTYKFSDSSSYKFFGNYIKMPIIKYKLGLASPGGAGRNRVLNKSEFLKIEVPLPCLDEQIKIANLLSKIDFIVEKEKEKLEELRLWKKGLLQQMFV